MRIGIDATPLPPQPVGAGNYIIQLIKALVEQKSDHDFVIFAQPSGQDMISLPEGSAAEWVIVEERSPGSRLIWSKCNFQN